MLTIVKTDSPRRPFRLMCSENGVLRGQYATREAAQAAASRRSKTPETRARDALAAALCDNDTFTLPDASILTLSAAPRGRLQLTRLQPSIIPEYVAAVKLPIVEGGMTSRTYASRTHWRRGSPRLAAEIIAEFSAVNWSTYMNQQPAQEQPEQPAQEQPSQHMLERLQAAHDAQIALEKQRKARADAQRQTRLPVRAAITAAVTAAENASPRATRDPRPTLEDMLAAIHNELATDTADEIVLWPVANDNAIAEFKSVDGNPTIANIQSAPIDGELAIHAPGVYRIRHLRPCDKTGAKHPALRNIQGETTVVHVTRDPITHTLKAFIIDFHPYAIKQALQ